MIKTDTDKIKKMTYQKIGYENYEKEELKKMKKTKYAIYSIGIIVTLIGGTFTVDAMIDNAISNTVKDFFTVKIDDKDYNAKCTNQNGSITCTIDKELTGGAEIEYNFDEKTAKDYDIKAEYKDDESSITIDSKWLV